MKKLNLTLILTLFIILLTGFFSCTKQINYQPQITALQSSLTALEQRCDSLATALGETNATIANLTTNVASITKTIDSIKTQLTGIVTQINTLNTELTQVNANVTSIDAQITTLNQEYTALLTQLNNIIAQLTITPTTLTNGLVAYYPFTGNANDLSGNGNNGTVHGATLTTDRFGNANSAYSFDGVSNYIGLPVLTALQNISQFTFSIWINTNYVFTSDPTGSGAGFFDQWTTTVVTTPPNVGAGIGVGNSANHAYGISLEGNASETTSANFIPVSTWGNLILVYDGTQTNVNLRVAVYLNGVFQAYIGDSGVPASIGPYANETVIGAAVGPFPNLNTTISYFYQGKLDDLRLYNRVLTQAEITYIGTH